MRPLTSREHVVYAAYATDGTCLYVGVTSNYPTRKSAHMAQSPWAPFADRWETTTVTGRREGLQLERDLIRARTPLFNVKKNPAPTADPYGVLQARLRKTSRPVILRADLEAWLTS